MIVIAGLPTLFERAVRIKSRWVMHVRDLLTYLPLREIIPMPEWVTQSL